ncbi:MAG: amidohydrolase family protein [Anaeromyxobacter sp.]|nr:amidohydrolase family protein [Anaeromyxobacter sp.]MBL0275443.1 amidohydrolase family protein [Anaeromyxobacter sp.]
MIRVLSAPWVLPGLAAPAGPDHAGPAAEAAPPLREGAVALDGDRVVAVGPRAAVEARHGEGERVDGVIFPALVNAHLHLELSHLAGLVPGGQGLPAWIERFVGVRRATGEAGAVAAMAAAAAALVEAGVAAVGDVSNTLGSLAPLAAAGLVGTVFHEVFGATDERLAAAREAAAAVRAAAPAAPHLRVVESPHALYSTAPAGLLALLRGPPASLHLAEDPAEREFAAGGAGPFAALRARMGGPPGQPGWARSPVALAAPHLAPGWLLVHCVDLDDEDLGLLRGAGCTVVLCPRSNHHISRAAPPLLHLLAAGVPLAIGTDSLASSPSLAPLAELARLRRDFPEVPPGWLLPLAWNGAAVGAPGLGRLAVGAAPGLLAAPLDGRPVGDPFDHLLAASSPGAPPLRWLARHHPEAPSP